MNLNAWQQLLTLNAVPSILLGIGASAAVVYLILSGAFRRNRQATTDYETTLVGNVEALKDRVTLLEKWREEASQLEQQVRDLKAQLRDIQAHYASELSERDAEITRLREELTKAQSDLAAAHAKIRRLEKSLNTGDTP